MQKYYLNERKFNGVHLRNKLPKIKDGACKINIDKYKSIGARWIAFYANNNNVTYFYSFGVEYIPKKIKKFIGNKSIVTNICRIQAYDSIVRGYFCIGFIDFMLKGKSLLDYSNLTSPIDYEKNDKILIRYFQ